MTPTMKPTPGPRATITTPSDREIRIERTFHASRDRIWKALTDPALVAQWWGPNGSRVEIERMEVRRAVVTGGSSSMGRKAPMGLRAGIAKSHHPSVWCIRSSGTACQATWSSKR